ncbi:hypothetical protein PI125_g1755 [Phytophthora idaei]|nr:hypothetical protein PI125_g1755 [Phytophthora idaei]
MMLVECATPSRHPRRSIMRRVPLTDHHWQAIHGTKDVLEIGVLERAQRVQRLLLLRRPRRSCDAPP